MKCFECVVEIVKMGLWLELILTMGFDIAQ